ncbi:MAG TPA: hypothetical protein VM686_18865 [Polyangiaceae bacterium]|nr:hypothetical protein [Polyangiaceae bacterium]
MAHTYAPDRFETPELAIRFITADRTRRGILAAVAEALAIIVTFGLVYVIYNDVPAPASPANNLNIAVDPYH